jgi:poly-gamma-glutamate capsule biosynthesis protein CapA/YwtB (metallophosphatase superfamily)
MSRFVFKRRGWLAALLGGLAFSAWAQLPVTVSAKVPPASVSVSAQDPEVSVVFMGDVMLADGPGRFIARGGDPFAPLARTLARADLRVANLECVVAQGGQKLDKPWTFRAHPRVLTVLQRHVDVVSVANNHSGDFGREAFAEMLTRLDKAGLPYFGGGRNLREAHAARIIERHGLKIALLGYDEFFPRHFEASAEHPGVAWSEDEQVVADIRRAREVDGADLVIPFMHWGQEHEPRANSRQRQLARLMIDAGADVVVGTHPHVVQDTEVYQGKPIIYSLGNFVFDGFTDPANNTGWLLWLKLGREGVRQWHIEVAHMDKQGTPHPASPAQLAWPGH